MRCDAEVAPGDPQAGRKSPWETWTVTPGGANGGKWGAGAKATSLTHSLLQSRPHTSAIKGQLGRT